MGKILGIKFRPHGQIYFFDSTPFVVGKGEYVLVKTEEGAGLGEVVAVRDSIPDGLELEELKPIYRIAVAEDMLVREQNFELSREAFNFCKARVEERQLEMKLVDVEVYFDRSKIIFYFTAPTRVDFRELVKDLVRNYRTRIELRQIGVRHETQMLGAVGNCGQMCCCRRFLRRFAPVTIKMAKEQNLFLNPAKISGICGRLLCCLNFEQENYEEFQRRCPKIGKKYNTTLGTGRIVRGNLFRDQAVLQLENGEEKEIALAEWSSVLIKEERGIVDSEHHSEFVRDAHPAPFPQLPIASDMAPEELAKELARLQDEDIPRDKGRPQKQNPDDRNAGQRREHKEHFSKNKGKFNKDRHPQHKKKYDQNRDSRPYREHGSRQEENKEKS